jgi:Spy/CpxP family protein refolding chaperone
MATITPQARSRRRRRKLVLATMLAGGAVLLGTRFSAAGDTPVPSAQDFDNDDSDVRGGDDHGEESQREVW